MDEDDYLCEEDDESDLDMSELESPADSVKKKKQGFKLSPHLSGLMGEANIRFARGEIEVAKKMCFEVIRQAPDAPEPYRALAEMHENQDVNKYKGFLMLAAFLNPSNTDVWRRLADVELQENRPSVALNWYSRGIRASPQDIDLHMKRLRLVQEKVPTRLKSLPMLKLSLAKALPKSEHEQILSLCSEVAKEYYENKNYSKAINALRVCTVKIPEKITQDILNMILELLLLSERYSECLDIFTEFCGFEFDVTVGEERSLIINSFTVPTDLHIDLRTKFINCLIGLQSYNLVEGLLKEMLEKEDIELNGMLYFDIAETLMSSHYYMEALQLLLLLVKSDHFSLAAVWLKHAECLTQLHMYDQAIEAYRKVIAKAPNHVDVLYPLAMLLLKQNRKEEALDALSQDFSSGTIHVNVLIEQMKLLKQIGDLDNYWKCCELFISRHSIRFINYTELRIAILWGTSVKEKRMKILKMRKVQGENEDAESSFECLYEPSVEEEYKLYIDILQFACDQKSYFELQKLAFMGLLSKRFTKQLAEIYIIACVACIYSKDYYHGYIIAKTLLFHYPDNIRIWNFYSIMIQKLNESVKLTRFFDAETVKCKLPIAYADCVKANHFCSSGNYAECLNYFLKDYKSNKNTYAAFMIGMVMLQQYCQRKKNAIEKKSLIETITYLFFNYAKIRSKYAQQEVFYNLGRMYQQMSVFYMAEHFYKLVLEVENEFIDKYSDYVDLKMEAAYNLHLIYRNSGNSAAARRILSQYIVI